MTIPRFTKNNNPAAPPLRRCSGHPLSKKKKKEDKAAATTTTTIMEVPCGYRFLPTDLELVKDYLVRRIANQKLPSDVAVFEYDIYSTEPWNLPVNNKIDAINNNRSYYFVKLFDGKMTTSSIDRRRQRVVNPRCDDNGVVGGGRRGGGGGYWKKIAGGRDTRYIRDESYRAVGVKKSFAFHAYVRFPHHFNNTTTTATTITSDDDDDNSDGTSTTTAMTTRKTNWIMDEYSLNSQRTQPWVLCILRRKGGVEEEDDEVQLLLLERAEQQQKELQPAQDLPDGELVALELIKNIQENIRANQIKIWDDQYKLREINQLRISLRLLKSTENMKLEFARNDAMFTQLFEGKLTISEVNELRQQRKEAEAKAEAKAKAEEAAIRAGSYYHVPLPSRFKRIRSNKFH